MSPMLKDRRKATRQDVSFTDSVAWFALKDRLYPIHIANRSEEGLGVIIRQRPPVDVGETVRMEWLKPSFVATEVVVRSVVKIDMDEWYMGVELAEVSASKSRHPTEPALAGAH